MPLVDDIESDQLQSLACERLLDYDGSPSGALDLGPVDRSDLLRLYRAMVVARRFDTQATALAKQGRLAIYPSALGQEACQVGSVAAMRPTDWLFPTYRDTMAMVSRGIDPVEALTLMRGDWHCGHDPHLSRTAPQCTPLATQLPHAVGLAMAARMAGSDLAVVAFCGDGGTSEGDFHEALNFAGVYQAPVVFLVQNNQFAISVPLAEQTRAGALADKAVGYGLPSRRIDGNDVLMVRQAVAEALAVARQGGGPALIEAVTYRMAPHTNADDPSRYRDEATRRAWADRDPVERFTRFLRLSGVLDDSEQQRAEAAAASLAEDLRARVDLPPEFTPAELFVHVYAEPTPQLREQAAYLEAQLQAEGVGRVGGAR